MLDKIKAWLSSVINGAVKTAVDEANADLKADLNALAAQLEALPLKIVGDAETTVKQLTGELTGSINDVPGQVNDLLKPITSAMTQIAAAINAINPFHFGGKPPGTHEGSGPGHVGQP